MTTNAAAMNIGCSTHAIRHLRQRFQATGRGRSTTWWTSSRHDVSRRVANNVIFGTPTRAIASKLPQLLLLTPMLYITIVYLPKLCAIACARWAMYTLSICWLCFLVRRHHVNRVNWAHTHQRWLRRRWNIVFFFLSLSDESRFTVHRGYGRVRVYRRGNELSNDCCVLERYRFGCRDSVLVWAGIHMAFALISSLSKGI